MSDPFLHAHHVAQRIFNISGKLTPVSIKDQMIRARLFVDRAAENGEISEAPNQGLLVIGGGACGITAALRALELGVPATVLEKSPRLFLLQESCTTRWLDPFQYDWPLEHWAAGRFPLSGAASMPLSFSPGPGPQVTQDWWLDLRAARAALAPSLSIHVQAQLAAAAPISHTAPNPFVTVQYTTSAGPQSASFGGVLVTSGFGTEKTRVGASFRGFPFWETDPLGRGNCGLPRATPARVVISGGGDGALQDFLRITTGMQSAKEVFQACGIPASIAVALKDVERRTACAYHWGEHAGHDHGLHMELEQEHRRQVGIALGTPRVIANLRGLLVNRPKTLTLVHVCQHLTPFYGLNRFLTLLIAEYLRQVDELLVIHPQTGVTGVVSSGSSHVCAADPHICHGVPHEVEFSAWGSCKDTSAGPTPWQQSVQRDHHSSRDLRDRSGVWVADTGRAASTGAAVLPRGVT